MLELIQSAKYYARSPQWETPINLTTEPDSALDKTFWARAINDSQLFHMNIIIKAAQDYFATQKTISFVSGQQHYDLPGNTIKIRYLEKTDSDPDEVITPIVPDRRLQYTDSEDSTDDDDALDHFAYVYGNLIGIVPNMASGTGSVNVLIIRRLPDLSYGTCSGTPTTTELILPATPTLGKTSIVNDYYNDATVRIISGTGVGGSSVASDYVGSTRALTISLTVAPTNASVYAFDCDIPVEYHPAVAMYAAKLAKGGRDGRDVTVIKEIHQEWVLQMMDGLTRIESKDNIVKYQDMG